MVVDKERGAKRRSCDVLEIGLVLLRLRYSFSIEHDKNSRPLKGETAPPIRELAQAFPPVSIYPYCAAFTAVFIYWEFGLVVLAYEPTMLSSNVYQII